MTNETSLDLSVFVQSEGVHIISPPRHFAGGEEAYDEHIGGSLREDALRCGRGAWQLVAHYAVRPIRTLLEIGSGGGTCSLGLVATALGVETLITDTSPTFLRMVRRKLGSAGISMEATHFATLAGEDLALLPDGCVDAMVVASALHHVGDWRAFLRSSARMLRPGGVLVIQEPCREGNLMMGMALDVVLSPLWPPELLQPQDMDRIAGCRDSIYFLADSTQEKIGEDKHSFLVTDLIAAADAAGFVGTAFYSNSHFHDLADSDFSNRQGRSSFIEYLASFLEAHHRVSPAGMQTLRQHLFPLLQRIDARFRAGDGAPLLGCMVFRR
jgi:ubiquinone/menaquinone biosynthesis C-methylase UbiE